MSVFETRAHVGADRKLVVTMPAGFENADVRVTVENSPVPTSPPATREALAAALDRVMGTIDDPTFVRHPQDESEERESLD